VDVAQLGGRLRRRRAGGGERGLGITFPDSGAVAWLPDSSAVVFTEYFSLVTVVAPVDGSAPRKLEVGGIGTQQAVSRDGRIAVTRFAYAGNQSVTTLAVVRADGTVLVALAGLDPTRGAEVYEAWVVPTSGSPVPVGSFTVASDGTGVLDAGRGPVVGGSRIALTREPGPGATKPTPPIVSSGTVRPSG
jgi:hypothetical protein